MFKFFIRIKIFRNMHLSRFIINLFLSKYEHSSTRHVFINLLDKNYLERVREVKNRCSNLQKRKFFHRPRKRRKNLSFYAFRAILSTSNTIVNSLFVFDARTNDCSTSARSPSSKRNMEFRNTKLV